MGALCITIFLINFILYIPGKSGVILFIYKFFKKNSLNIISLFKYKYICIIAFYIFRFCYLARDITRGFEDQLNF
jgi:hypothetical protein